METFVVFAESWRRRREVAKVREVLLKMALLMLLRVLSFKELYRLREDMVGKEVGVVGWSWDISLLHGPSLVASAFVADRRQTHRHSKGPLVVYFTNYRYAST